MIDYLGCLQAASQQDLPFIAHVLQIHTGWLLAKEIEALSELDKKNSDVCMIY